MNGKLILIRAGVVSVSIAMALIAPAFAQGDATPVATATAPSTESAKPAARPAQGRPDPAVTGRRPVTSGAGTEGPC